MRYLYILSLLLVVYACGSNTTVVEKKVAQKSTLWVAVTSDKIPTGEKNILTDKFHCYLLNIALMKEKLNETSLNIELPVNNKIVSFQLENAGTLSPELAKKFPEIKSLQGKSTDGKYTVRFDKNEKGVFAQITAVGEKVLISPLFKSGTKYYASYNESDIPLEKRPKLFYK